MKEMLNIRDLTDHGGSCKIVFECGRIVAYDQTNIFFMSRNQHETFHNPKHIIQSLHVETYDEHLQSHTLVPVHVSYNLEWPYRISDASKLIVSSNAKDASQIIK